MNSKGRRKTRGGRRICLDRPARQGCRIGPVCGISRYLWPVLLLRASPLEWEALSHLTPCQEELTMRIPFCPALATCLILCLSPLAVAEWSVWTETATRRVLRDAPAGTEATVDLSAARNEWESFQVLMRSTRSLTITDVEMSDLVSTESNGKQSVIPGSAARVYRQHQFEITVPTHRNENFKPGWYPDALIPTRPIRSPASRYPSRVSRQSPFDLPPNETHGFLIDVYVPQRRRGGRLRGRLPCYNQGIRHARDPGATPRMGFRAAGHADHGHGARFSGIADAGILRTAKEGGKGGTAVRLGRR